MKQVIPIHSGILKSGAIGAISRALSFGVGVGMDQIFTAEFIKLHGAMATSIVRPISSALLHAHRAGFIAAIEGGNVDSQMLSGLVSS